MSATRCIYALLDPRDQKIRYVGQTRNGAESRAHGHVLAAKRGQRGHKANWLRELLADNLEPEVEVLEEGDWSQESTDIRERYWIANLRESLLAQLTNVMPGGLAYDGPRSPSETRGASLSAWLSTEEGKSQRRQAMLDRYIADPGQRMRDTETSRLHWQKPENIALLAQRLKKLYNDEPQRRDIIAEQSRVRWADPDYTARKTLQSDSYRAQRRAIATEIASRKRVCNECGHVTGPGNMSRHQKAHRHSGWISLVEEVT